MSDSDRESRLNAARNVIAITEIEGGAPSPRVRELREAYVDGHITVTEMRQAVLEHYGLPPKESE